MKPTIRASAREACTHRSGTPHKVRSGIQCGTEDPSAQAYRHPDSASERLILRDSDRRLPDVAVPTLSAEEVLRLQDAVHRVRVEESLVDYMLAIVDRTRNHESLVLGVSPRAAQALFRAVQALALVEGRDFAVPDDIKRLAVPTFAHRVVINTRTTLVPRRADTAERMIEEILTRVDVPL